MGRKSKTNGSRTHETFSVLLLGMSLLVAFVAWAFASPVASSADDRFHHTSTWCAWGSWAQCQVGPDGEALVPAQLADACFTSDSTISAACQKSGTSEWISPGGALSSAAGRPLLVYQWQRLFVTNSIETSVLGIRIANAILASLVLTAALLLVNTVIRRALLVSWMIVSVPMALFFIPSVNPSGWAIVGVGTFWAFLYSWLSGAASSQRRQILVALGGIGSAAIALGARFDSGIYLAAALVAISIIAWPTVRHSWWRLAILLAPVPVLLLVATLRLGGLGGALRITPLVEGAGTFTNGGFPALAGQILRYAVDLPLLWAGVIGMNRPVFNQTEVFMWGIGQSEVLMPGLVFMLGALALGGVLWWAVNDRSVRKWLGVAVVLGAVAVTPLLTLVRFDFTNMSQARYVAPGVLLFVAVIALVTGDRKTRIGTRQAVLIAAAMSSSGAVALLATIRRYTNGQSETWLSLSFTPEWWWVGLPHPLWFWLVGAIAWSLFCFGSIRFITAVAK